jgi:hypothetical protein
MKRVSFRQRMLVVVAAAVVPLAVMSAVALYAGYQQARAQAERSGLDVARALSIAVEAELRRTISVLQVLDDALEVEKEDLRSFHETARRARVAHPYWRAIVLFDPQGHMVLSSEVPFGDLTPALVERESLEQTVRAQAPTVGYLARGPKGNWGIPVRVPVLRGKQVRYVLTAILEPEAILNVLRGQRVPDEYVVAIADAKGIRVARTRSSGESVGTPYSTTLVEMMRKSGDEGRGVTYNTEGDAVFTAYTRSRETGWYTAVGLPTTGGRRRRPALLHHLGRRHRAVPRRRRGVRAAPARSVTTTMEKLRNARSARWTAGASRPRRATSGRSTTWHGSSSDASPGRAASCWRASRRPARPRRRRTAPRTSSSRCSGTSCATRSAPSPMRPTLLQAPNLSPEAATKARGVIARQVNHLTRLTDDLLEVGRALMGKIQLRRRSATSPCVVGQTIATLKSAQRLREHHVIEEYQPVWVDCDPIRVDQIVSNLLVNAVKYTPRVAPSA